MYYFIFVYFFAVILFKEKNRIAVQEINENRKLYTENFIFNGFSLDTFWNCCFCLFFYSHEMQTGLINFWLSGEKNKFPDVVRL